MIKRFPFKQYLGDSVYADFDGFAVTLTTENDPSVGPSNVIIMEPEIIAALNRYVEWSKQEMILSKKENP